MIKFHEHDGLIFLNEVGYCATPEQFNADLAQLSLPAYEGLPEGMRERRYTPGGLHTVHTADTQFGVDGDWANGDLYIAHENDLLALQTARQVAAQKAIDDARTAAQATLQAQSQTEFQEAMAQLQEEADAVVPEDKS